MELLTRGEVDENDGTVKGESRRMLVVGLRTALPIAGNRRYLTDALTVAVRRAIASPPASNRLAIASSAQERKTR